jgi:hypothetical protein
LQENIDYFYTNLSKLIEFEKMNGSFVEIFNDIQLELTRMGLNMEKLMKVVKRKLYVDKEPKNFRFSFHKSWLSLAPLC